MSRTTQEQKQKSHKHFEYGTITLWGPSFQTGSSMFMIVNSSSTSGTSLSYNPDTCKHASVWASPFSLAATRGIPESRSLNRMEHDTETETVSLVSFPPGTEMFHFPGYALMTHVMSLS